MSASENLLQKEAKMMKLEKLIAQREGVPTQPFPVPVKEMPQRCERLYTGAISNVPVRAEEIRANEKKIFGWVAEGQNIHQITEKGGYF